MTSPDGSAQTVEYTCIGGGEVYLPEFLAMYNIRQSREYLTAVTQNQAPDIESQIEQAVGGIPETAEEAQDYLNGAWQGMVDGRGAVNLDLFRMANLKSIIEGASIDGAVKISTERTSDKLSITLETVGSDIWEDIFGIDEELKQYVEQSQLAIEMALDEAEISQDERTISLDGMVQAAMFRSFTSTPTEQRTWEFPKKELRWRLKRKPQSMRICWTAAIVFRISMCMMSGI